MSTHPTASSGLRLEGGMSKPRSCLIARADHEFRTVRGFTTVLHFGKQAKHMPGQPNHDASKSTITVSITELQHLSS